MRRYFTHDLAARLNASAVLQVPCAEGQQMAPAFRSLLLGLPDVYALLDIVARHAWSTEEKKITLLMRYAKLASIVPALLFWLLFLHVWRYFVPTLQTGLQRTHFTFP